MSNEPVYFDPDDQASLDRLRMLTRRLHSAEAAIRGLPEPTYEADTDAAPPVPLTGTAKAIADCIDAEPGINGPGIEFKLKGTPHETSHGHIRRVISKKLKTRGYSGPGDGRDGYYPPGM